MFWPTLYLGVGWKEVEYGEALDRNSRGSRNHGGNDARHCSYGQCSSAGSTDVRTLATSAVRVGVGMAVLLVVEMVHQLLDWTKRSMVRRLGWLGVGLMAYIRSQSTNS